MSLSRPILPRLNDLILGSFAFVQPNATLEHLVRYLGTWSGSDKLFMIIQYLVKLLAPLLNLRARLQYRAGFRKSPYSAAAVGCAKLGKILCDSRALWRIWGLLPTIQWLIALERIPQPTRYLLTIKRLQGWSMLAYYPLEHITYLRSHGIIPSTFPTLSSLFSSSAEANTLNPGTLGMWSTRFWAVYIMLQFAHLREDKKLLQMRQRTLRKSKSTGLITAEKQDLQQRWDAYWSDLIANLCYFPLTIHWSLKRGLFQNEVWIGVLGLIAGLVSFRSGWKATSLPLPSSSTPPSTPKKSRSPEPFKIDGTIYDDPPQYS